MSELLVENAADTATARVAVRPPHLLKRILTNPLGMASLLWLAFVGFIAVAGNWLAPYAPTKVDLFALSEGISGQHILGTDSLGRDVLSRLFVGAWPSISGVLVAVLVFAVIGISLGIIAGYFGGWFDVAVGRLNDVVMSLPGLILLLVVLTIFPSDQNAAMVTLGILGAPGLVRVTRAVTLSIREELYISAARVFGLSDLRILVRHIWPRIRSTAIVQLALFCGSALAVESGLAFLGFGPQAPNPSWGGMIADASKDISSHPWQVVPGGLIIGLTVIAFGLLGNAVRDAVSETWSRSQTQLLRRTKVSDVVDVADLAPSASLLAVRDLQVSVISDGVRRTVVRSVSLDIAPGETIGVVGESACGKTLTSLGLIGALPPGAEITGGTVLLEGKDLASMPSSERDSVRGGQIGYVSQEPALALDPMFTVGNQLKEAVRRHHRLGRREADERVLKLLSMVRLPDPVQIARQYPHQLSGGMAQRVGIALALAGEPKLLIADEPTTALDVTTQAEILELLQDLKDKTGMATLLVTHDWGVVAALCDRAIVMYAGEIVETGPVGELFCRPRHPYTAALLKSNPRVLLEQGNGFDSHEAGIPHLPTIPGEVPAPGTWGNGCAFTQRCAFATSACREGSILLEPQSPGHMSRCIHASDINLEVVIHESA